PRRVATCLPVVASQMVMVPPKLAVASFLALGEKATAEAPVGPGHFARSLPAVVSEIVTILSGPRQARSFPSPESAAKPGGCCGALSLWPVAGFQSWVTDSLDVTNVPSGAKATDLSGLPCWRIAGSSIVAISQSIMAPSALPEASVFPSGENATAQTAAR